MSEKKIKYAKGSKVRCIRSYIGSAFLEGEIYEVREDFLEDHKKYESLKIVEDSNGSTTNGWGHEYFEAYVPKKAKKSKASFAHSPGFQQGEVSLIMASKGTGKSTALQTQVGGTHYTDMAIQPIEYILANNIPFPEGNAIKYVSRWRSKGGLKDLRKAIHHLELLIESEEAKGTL